MIPEFGTLAMIARRFDVTTRACRRWLAELELWNATSGPTPRARHSGLVPTVFAGPDHSHGRGCVWHIASTVDLLQTAGHCQMPEGLPIRAGILVGPFTEHSGGIIGREICNGHGEVFCWALREAAAACIVRLLNRADRSGGLPDA